MIESTEGQTDFKPRKPDFTGSLPVAGWNTTVVLKDGRTKKAISVKIGKDIQFRLIEVD